jgi:hypothetical protein
MSCITALASPFTAMIIGSRLSESPRITSGARALR